MLFIEQFFIYILTTELYIAFALPLVQEIVSANGYYGCDIILRVDEFDFLLPTDFYTHFYFEW